MKDNHKKILLCEISKRVPYGLKCRFDLDGYLAWNEEYRKIFEGVRKIKPDLYDKMKSRAYTIDGLVLDRVSLVEFEECDDYLVPVEFVKPYLYSMGSVNSPLKMLSETDLTGSNSLMNFILSMVSQNNLHKIINTISIRFDWMCGSFIDTANLLDMNLAIEVGPDGFPYNDIVAKEEAKENSVVYKDGSVFITIDGRTINLTDKQLAVMNKLLESARQSNVGSAWIDNKNELHILNLKKDDGD